VLAAAIAAAGCTPAATTPPAADPSSALPSFGGGDMPPGTHVQVARQGQWYGATILQPLGEGRFLVHYDNTGNEWNEPVGPDRLKAFPGGGAPAGPARDYHAGEKVLVTFQNRLLLGEIVTQVGADSWRVHYEGFGAEASESVGPDRMKRPFAGASGHHVGESLVVDVNGTPLPAKVLAVSSADHWVVRFESFGPQYDQEVGIDRIKAAGPPTAEIKAEKAVEKAAEKAAEVKVEKATVKAEKAAEKAAEKVAEKAKPKPPAEGAPAVPVGPPSVGENVLVSVRGAWFPASVVGVAAGTVKVKFTAGGEEDVPEGHVLRGPESTRGLHYQPAQLVLIDYKGVFVPGKVLKQEGKAEYKVRFDGQGPEGDEVIPVKRLRPR
jgi:hypothetical protein